MKKLSINITKAQLVSFSVELKDGQPEVGATIALITDGGKAITTYSISTDSWNNKDKFKLPMELMPLLGDAARILEGVVVRHCRDGQLALGAGGLTQDEEAAADQEADAERAKGDPIIENPLEPINLEDIPF
jgi:hypothetical protein